MVKSDFNGSLTLHKFCRDVLTALLQGSLRSSVRSLCVNFVRNVYVQLQYDHQFGCYRRTLTQNTKNILNFRKNGTKSKIISVSAINFISVKQVLIFEMRYARALKILRKRRYLFVYSFIYSTDNCVTPFGVLIRRYTVNTQSLVL